MTTSGQRAPPAGCIAVAIKSTLGGQMATMPGIRLADRHHRKAIKLTVGGTARTHGGNILSLPGGSGREATSPQRRSAICQMICSHPLPQAGKAIGQRAQCFHPRLQLLLLYRDREKTFLLLQRKCWKARLARSCRMAIPQATKFPRPPPTIGRSWLHAVLRSGASRRWTRQTATQLVHQDL